MTYKIVIGTEEPLDVQLLDDGQPLVGTGFTVALVFRETVASPPTVAWLSQAAGTVRVNGVEVLTLGRYHVRYKLTDGAGDDGFVPNGNDPDVWEVVRV